MTPQPPLQPSEDPSEDGTQPTTPLWYSQTGAQPQYPTQPLSPEASAQRQASAEPLPRPDLEPARPAKRHRFAELVAVAVLAAILSSAGTYALVRRDVEAAPAVQDRSSASASIPRTPVVQGPVAQANPAAPNWTVTASAVAPSVVAITVTKGQSAGQGSGVIIDTQGNVLTNNHVVTTAGQGAQISVTLNDKRTYDATIVGTDPSTDLAVIKLTGPPNDLKAIVLGDDNTLKVGEPVMAVGNPLGLAGTVTTGIVSALNRPVTTAVPRTQSQDPFDPQQPVAEPVVTNAVQTSAPINPGNSGGALVNGSGQLVGINSSIASLGSGGPGGNIGIGFAIPVNEAKSVSQQLITSGRATHAFLGVNSRDDVVSEGSAKRAAAVLVSIEPGTPADTAGLQVGDAIIAVDNETIDGRLSLIAQIRERTAGEKVTIAFLRDGQRREVSVTLADRPATTP